MPSITGGIVVSGSRILVPTDVATARPGLTIPAVATIGESIIVRRVDRIDYVDRITNVDRVDYVDRVGMIDDGRITASVMGGRIDQLSTIINGKITASVMGGRIDHMATILDGKITASAIGGRIDQLSTIINGKITASVMDGRITASILTSTITFHPPSITYVTLNVSGTIKGTAGIFFGGMVSTEDTPATVLLLNYGAPTSISTIFRRLIVGTYTTYTFTSAGVRFSTLVASLIGTKILLHVEYI